MELGVPDMASSNANFAFTFKSQRVNLYWKILLKIIIIITITITYYILSEKENAFLYVFIQLEI